MSREFKFRAWDKKERQMITDTKGNYVVSNIGLLKPVEDKFDLIDITRFELMQCTGVEDEDEIETYEGDIIYFKHKNMFGSILEATAPIEFIQGEFGIAINEISQWWSLSKLLGMIGRNFKVIGNIYENKELLEGE